MLPSEESPRSAEHGVSYRLRVAFPAAGWKRFVHIANCMKSKLCCDSRSFLVSFLVKRHHFFALKPFVSRHTAMLSRLHSDRWNKLLVKRRAWPSFIRGLNYTWMTTGTARRSNSRSEIAATPRVARLLICGGYYGRMISDESSDHFQVICMGVKVGLHWDSPPLKK